MQSKHAAGLRRCFSFASNAASLATNDMVVLELCEQLKICSNKTLTCPLDCVHKEDDSGSMR
jgi:hypothetical protein